MRKLTIVQQMTLVKRAREYAKQNHSKPQKSDKKAKAFVGQAVARAPQESGVSVVPATSVNPPRDGQCKKCGYSWGLEFLQTHEKNCAKVPKPSTPDPPIVPEEVYECPKCDLDMPVKERDQHLKTQHDLILCNTCGELLVDGIESQKHFLDHIESSTAKNGASVPQGVRWDSSSYHRSWDGTDPIILGGGLCNGK